MPKKAGKSKSSKIVTNKEVADKIASYKEEITRRDREIERLRFESARLAGYLKMRMHVMLKLMEEPVKHSSTVREDAVDQWNSNLRSKQLAYKEILALIESDMYSLAS